MDFTTILALESRAFSGALKIEKLKAPLIPGLEGAVDTNDWCITYGIFSLLNFTQKQDSLSLYMKRAYTFQMKGTF